ncbi:MFS family permease [Azospirillum lipoferum]|uniref:MFS transporter n=1 Tax=Azospirillum lipoferum TaxID=193 RepID=A0A5A9GQW7_AZOLI|nr:MULTISPECIES: MFS transporter [Azospirillum]KAA0596757.1 MFS transporter [Azospirillum lipoferum]MCP1610784.1 MFS family permease [Azospirillum lipoferum]MDW5537772.1 MFS transporter [Azospirillum sp. NL1]
MRQAVAQEGGAAEAAGGTVRWGLAGLALAMLLSSLGVSIANVGLPALARAFDVPFREVQWVVLAYLLAITTLIVGVGRLGDIVGRRRLLLTGIGLFTVGSAACAAASGLWMLVAARAVQGLGAAAMMALATAFVGDAVPKERIGRAMGLMGTTSAIGTALGPTLGGVLIAAFGWPAIFLVTVPPGLVAFLLVRRYLPAGRAEARVEMAGGAGRARESFDIPGMLILALTLGTYALAMTGGRSGFGWSEMLLLLAAAGGAWLFLTVESRTASPLLRLEMLRDRALRGRLAMNMLVATVLMATLVVGPFHLARGLGLETGMVGLAMSAGPLVSALTGVPAGRVVDRFGAARMTILGLTSTTVGCVLLALLPATLGVVGYVGPLVVVTAGYALFQAANNTAVMADVEKDRRGVVSGVLNLSRNLGLITGASVMGTVFTLGVGAEIAAAAPDAVAAGTRTTFAVAAGLIGVALVLAARMRR